MCQVISYMQSLEGLISLKTKRRILLPTGKGPACTLLVRVVKRGMENILGLDAFLILRNFSFGIRNVVEWKRKAVVSRACENDEAQLPHQGSPIGLGVEFRQAKLSTQAHPGHPPSLSMQDAQTIRSRSLVTW